MIINLWIWNCLHDSNRKLLTLKLQICCLKQIGSLLNYKGSVQIKSVLACNSVSTTDINLITFCISYWLIQCACCFMITYIGGGENPFAVHLGRIQALTFKQLYSIVESSTFSVEDYWQCNLFLICTVQQYNFLVATIKIISTCYIRQHFEQAALMEENQRDWIKVNRVWVKVLRWTV